MKFLTSTILSGIIYDIIKSGMKLSISNVFKVYDVNKMNYSVCEDFIDKINTIDDDNKRIEYTNKLLKDENIYTTMFEKKLYPTNFAKRFDYIIALMNDCGYMEERVNIEKLGEYLCFDSVNDLKQYYINSFEPDYTFSEKIANKIGVNAEWLKHEDGEPFASSLRRIYNATDIYLQAEFNDVDQFIFVMGDNSYRRDIGVIIRIDKFKYKYYPRTFVFHADVGATGASELMSVYNFLKQLNSQGKMPSGLYKLPEKEMLDIFLGKVYPGSIKKYKLNWCNYLLDDFIDLYNSDEKKDNYKRMYGDTFVSCQDIIKHKLIQER